MVMRIIKLLVPCVIVIVALLQGVYAGTKKVSSPQALLSRVLVLAQKNTTFQQLNEAAFDLDTYHYDGLHVRMLATQKVRTELQEICGIINTKLMPYAAMCSEEGPENVMGTMAQLTEVMRNDGEASTLFAHELDGEGVVSKLFALTAFLQGNITVQRNAIQNALKIVKGRQWKACREYLEVMQRQRVTRQLERLKALNDELVEIEFLLMKMQSDLQELADGYENVMDYWYEIFMQKNPNCGATLRKWWRRFCKLTSVCAHYGEQILLDVYDVFHGRKPWV